MHFVIPGEPTGKGRPRVVRRGNFTQTYTPDKTVAYENLVKLEYERQCGHQRIVSGMPVQIIVTAYYAISRTDSRRTREKKLSGILQPMKKPDADNVLKVIADALNHMAYDDDSQIVFAVVRKLYSETPRVEVEIKITEGENSNG